MESLSDLRGYHQNLVTGDFKLDTTASTYNATKEQAKRLGTMTKSDHQHQPVWLAFNIIIPNLLRVL